jgi:VWFA-related protein
MQIDAFLKADGGRLAHPTTLAIFTDNGIRMQPDFTSDGNALSASLDQEAIGLREIRRDSEWGAEDRLQLSLNAFHTLAAQEATRPGRKIILWVSPGWPYLSGPGVELDGKQEQQLFAQVVGLSTILLRGSITVYAIDSLGPGEDVDRTNYYQEYLKGVAKPNQVQLGNLALQVLAVQSGGLAVGPSNDITGLLQRCMADTTAHYELSFDPLPPDRRNGDYHKIDIKVSRPGLTARTRTGYYSQP